MTLEAADISIISNGKITVGSTGQISETSFSYLAGIAKSMYLDVEGSGLPEGVYDYCHGLLVLHLYEVGKGHTGFSSESQNNYDYTQSPGKTGWLLQYRDAIATYNKSRSKSARPTTQIDQTRADASMSAFKLDQGKIPTFFRELSGNG